jgi:hypothetical protein
VTHPDGSASAHLRLAHHLEKKLLALLCINMCLYAFLLVFSFRRLRLEADRGHCKTSGAVVGLELEDEAITWLEKTSNWIFYLSF